MYALNRYTSFECVYHVLDLVYSIHSLHVHVYSPMCAYSVKGVAWKKSNKNIAEI